MRRFASILVGLLVTIAVGGSTFGQVQQQPQAAQPQQEQQLSAPPTVLVLPFTMLNNDGKHDWIGQGIQQNLQAELGRAGLEVVGTVQVKPMNRAPVIVRPEDEVDAALKTAAEAKADVVIFGNYQVVEQNVRVTGRVMDVASGQTVGFIKADGNVRDLLSVEDQLSKETLSYFRIEGGAAAAAEADAQPVQQRAEDATQPVTEVTETVVEEPAVYQPTEETSIVYSPRYYDDDIDDYDWVGAATYYPTYYPVGYYYPTYSYYYRPYCYRPSYWTSFSFGFHYGRHYGGHHHHHDYHDRYARWHDDDDDHHWRYGRNARGSRGDLRDRGSRFRDDDRDGVRGVRPRTVVALDRQQDRDRVDRQQEAPRTVRYDKGSQSDPKRPRYSWASEKRIPQLGPQLRGDDDQKREAVRPRVAVRDEGNRRVITVPDKTAERGDRDGGAVKRVTPPAAKTPDRDRAARLVKPDSSSKNDRTTVARGADQDRAARLMGKDDSNSGRSVARSDPDRAASLLRGNDRSSSSSSSSRSEAPTVRRSEPSPSRSSGNTRSSSVRSSSSGRETRSSSSFGSRSPSSASSRSAVSGRSAASRGDSSFRSSASSSQGSSSLRSSPSSRGGSSIRSSSSSSSRGSSFRSSSSSSSSRGGSSFRSSSGGGGRGGSGRGK